VTPSCDLQKVPFSELEVGFFPTGGVASFPDCLQRPFDGTVLDRHQSVVFRDSEETVDLMEYRLKAITVG
jgi:hypothetical protein